MDAEMITPESRQENSQQSSRKKLLLGKKKCRIGVPTSRLMKCRDEESKCTSYATDRIKRAVAKAQGCAFHDCLTFATPSFLRFV